MSDDFLSGFLNSLKESFERGWNAPVAHSVRSRPNFWNPFHTWRAEEERQLRELYGRANQAFDTSVFASDDMLDELLSTMIADVCNTADRDPHDPSIGAMIDASEELVRAEFFTFPDMSDSDWRNLDLGSANALRGELERKLACLADWKGYLQVALRALADLWSSLATTLPSQFSNEGAQTAPALTTDLLSLIDKPHEHMTAVLAHFISNEDIQQRALFAPLCRQLYRNVLEASGVFVDPDKPLASYDTEKPMFPEHCTEEPATVVAERYFRNTPLLAVLTEPVPVDIPEASRFEHCHVLGGTGHGKTQLLQYFLHEDLIRALQDRASVVVIDSQGDMIRKLSSNALFHPDADGSLADRFMLIDPADIEYPPALNLFDAGLERMDQYTPQQRELAFNSLVDIYGRFFGALLGAELTARQGTVFRYLARLMLTIKGATIHTLITLMDDIAPFKNTILQLDPTARQFFEKEFTSKSFHATRQQIKQRLYAVLSIPTFDRLFSAPKSKINFFDALNDGNIILVNTAKDLLKSDGAAIFGRFILALIEHAVMERATIDEQDRTPVFLYIDEAQDYFDDTVETLLVQARKYRCSLVLAHQNLAQLSPRLKAVFMGNTTIKLAGGVTDSDARALASDMRTTPDFLLSMRKRNDATEFALSVRNLTAQALKVSVPLGYLEGHPKLDPQQRSLLLEQNRQRIGYSPSKEPAKPSTEDVQTSEQSAPEPPLHQELSHRDIQDELKRVAQHRGFAATVEQAVLDGAGSVDVSIETDDLRIACEISVTTKSEHEYRNIEKCLAAGYDSVWVTSPDPDHVSALRDDIAPRLAQAKRERVRFLTLHQIKAQLDRLATTAPSTSSTVLGYQVQTTHSLPDDVHAAERRKRLAATVKRLRPSKKSKR